MGANCTVTGSSVGEPVVLPGKLSVVEDGGGLGSENEGSLVGDMAKPSTRQSFEPWLTMANWRSAVCPTSTWPKERPPWGTMVKSQGGRFRPVPVSGTTVTGFCVSLEAMFRLALSPAVVAAV